MIVDTLLGNSRETHQIEAFYNALKSVGEIDVKPLRGESWFDGLYMTGHGPEDEVDIDESWLDDLNEAA